MARSYYDCSWFITNEDSGSYVNPPPRLMHNCELPAERVHQILNLETNRKETLTLKKKANE